MMAERIPAEAFAPGEYLADELEARGWSQADFADIIGRPVQFVSELINAKKELTAESAAQIAAALGSEASTWLGLQSAYQLWLLRQQPAQRAASERVAIRAKIANVVPLALLERRGIIAASERMEDVLGEVWHDFTMESETDVPAFRMAAKRANPTDDLSLTQRGWLWAAQRLARVQSVADYDAEAFAQLVAGLAQSIHAPADLANLPERFEAVGVHLVFVEQFPGGKIDGAAFVLDGHPVVAISGRGKRFDKVLFALLHECAHIVLGHVVDGLAMDDNSDDGGALEGSPKEAEANQQAELWALGGPIQLSGQPTLPVIANKAAELGVAVALVVGNLQKRGVVPWKSTLARGLPNADDVLQAWATTTA